jgi:dolichyl-phosphate beta-glucosyltransferase
MPRTTIVVPCYNEARRLDVAQLRRFVKGRSLRMLLVDDGSTDQTGQLLGQLVQADPLHFLVHTLPRNAGKGEAVREGLLRAIDEGAQYVGYWDADLSAPLAAIASFADVLDRRPQVQAVLGVRMPLLGRELRRSLARHVLGRLFATCASAVLGLRMYDTQCGAKLLRVSPQMVAALAKPFHSRWIFDVEILARLRRIHHRRTGLRLRDLLFEYPLEDWTDVPGSKVRPGDFVRGVWQLAVVYWQYCRPGSPPVPVASLASDREARVA